MSIANYLHKQAINVLSLPISDGTLNESKRTVYFIFWIWVVGGNDFYMDKDKLLFW